MIRVRLALFLCSIACLLSQAVAGDPPTQRPDGGRTPLESPRQTDPVRIVIETSLGGIEVAVYPEKAPKTVENFLRYVEDGFYNGTVFHRIVPDFVIQGGGQTKDLKPKSPSYPPIRLESRAGLKNVRGAVAMARSSGPNSATCQFFINLRDNPQLDFPGQDGNGYAVFGMVVEGMDVVDRIVGKRIKEEAAKGPFDPVVIRSVRELR